VRTSAANLHSAVACEDVPLEVPHSKSVNGILQPLIRAERRLNLGVRIAAMHVNAKGPLVGWTFA